MVILPQSLFGKIEMRTSNTIVVDSDVMVKWFIPEDYSHEAETLLRDFIYGRIQVIAPVHAMIEYCNAIRKYVARKIISIQQALRAYKLFLEIEVDFKDIDPILLMEALKYGIDHNITIYDSYYIVLAKYNNAVMYTADEKLLKKIKDIEHNVKHIKEYTKTN